MISRHRMTAYSVRRSAANASNVSPWTKSCAAVAFSSMSRSARRPRSESIDGVAFRFRAHVRLEALPVGHVDGPRKEPLDELNHAHVIIDIEVCCWVEFNQNIDVAARTRLATSDGAEQGRPCNAEVA